MHEGSLQLHVVKRRIPLTELSDLFAGLSQPRVEGWQIIIHISYENRCDIPIPLVFRETSVLIKDGNRTWRHRSGKRNKSDKVMEIFGLTKSTDDDKLILSCPLRDDLVVKLSKGQRLALGLPVDGPDVHIDAVRPVLSAYLANPGADIQLFDRILYQSQKPILFNLDPEHAKVMRTTLYWKFAVPISRPLQESLDLIALARERLNPVKDLSYS
eukprot:Gregarina_sp_Poly_1__6683@NODE_35_length_18769_cov_73_980644_g30_i0_p10_GENE_NODE_35_length_18769_cov_73_980644_g30_i0NODE_35_length_18769_cov_73_980644_g30_i0_p10_ORF_typecomplete_len214_score11_65_NODE_35_length_18769_cov_73_980644_g30_i015672208